MERTWPQPTPSPHLNTFEYIWLLKNNAEINPTDWRFEELKRLKCQSGAPCWLMWMIYLDIFKGAQQRKHLNLSLTPATLTIRQIVKICLGTLADNFFLQIQKKRCVLILNGDIKKYWTRSPIRVKHSVGWIGESEAWGLRILDLKHADFRPPKKDFCFTNG